MQTDGTLAFTSSSTCHHQDCGLPQAQPAFQSFFWDQVFPDNFFPFYLSARCAIHLYLCAYGAGCLPGEHEPDQYPNYKQASDPRGLEEKPDDSIGAGE